MRISPRRLAGLFLSSAFAVVLSLLFLGQVSGPVSVERATPAALLLGGEGYWLVGGDGEVYEFGDAGFHGSTGGIPLNKPIVGMAPTPFGDGYWLVATDGGIFGFGDARFFGSTGAITLNKPIVGMAATPSGNGYWLVASDGGIFAFGDARFFGSTGAITLNQPIVGMAPTPFGEGYWLVASDGGLFAFGDAQFFGSTGDMELDSPIVGMAPTPLFFLNEAPTAAITGGPADGGLTSDSTPTYSGTASDPDDGSVEEVQASVDGGDFSGAGVVCTGCSTDTATWSFTPGALADGVHTVRVRAVDDFGDVSDIVSRTVTVDATAPTVTVEQAATGQNDPTNASPVNFVVQFSETVTGFATGDVTLSGGAGATTATVTAVDGDTYNVAVTGMTGDGTVVATVAAGRATDAAGNGNAASTSTDNTVTRDATAPTVTVEQAATGQNDPTNASPVNFTVAFSEPVTGFVAADVATTAPGTETVVVSGGPTTYNVAVSNMTDGTVTASVPASAAQDAAGNASAASTSTDNSVIYDATAPSATVEQAAGQNDPTNDSTIDFVVQFTEAVTGFATGDVTLSGGAGATTATVTAVDGDTYNVAVTGMANDGTVIAAVGSGKAADAAGNTNTASTSTDNIVTLDTAAPTFNSISVGAGSTTVTATFSELVLCSSVAPGDFTAKIEAGSVIVSGAQCGGASDTTIDLTLASAPTGGDDVDVTVTGSITDRAGNAVATPTTRSATASNFGPTLGITAGPADNGSTADTTPTYSGTASDSDGNVSSVQVAIDGGAASTTGVTCTNCGTGSATWTFTPTSTLSEGAHSFAFQSVDSGGFTSSIVTRAVTVDSTAPTVTVAKAGSQPDPTNESTIDFVVQFSETVTGFATGDVTPSGTAGASTATITAVDGDTYNVAVTGMTGDGSVVVTVPGSVAQDTTGNVNTAAPSPATVGYDNTVPTVTIEQASDQEDPTNDNSIDFVVQFSETVSGFATGDVTPSGTAGASTATITAVDGDTYDVAVTGMTGNGTVIATVAGGVATDSAGNANAASTSSDNTVTYDTVVPTFDAVQATTGSTSVVAVFSEPLLCSTVTAADFTATVGSLPTTIASATCAGTSDATIGLVLGSAPAAGQAVSVTLLGTVGDPAGNNATAPTTRSSTPPSVSITGGPADDASTNDTTPTYSGSAADSDTGGTVSSVEASIDGGGFSTTGVVCTNCGTASATWTYTSPAALAAGAHTVGFRSIDNTGSVSSTATRDVVVDLTAPTVTVEEASTQADPTNTGPIEFTVTFSEPVNGFTAGDVNLSGTSGGTKVAAITAGADGSTTFTVEVSGMTEGTVVASVPANAATDLAGNNSAASTSTDNTVTYDTTSPTVTINQKSDQADPSNVSPINFTVVFTEAVTGFDDDDVSVSGSAGADTATVSGSGTTYNVAVSGMTGSGSVIASIAANAATDLAGNNSAASTSTDNTVTYDEAVPSVSISQKSGQVDPTNASPINFTVVFSEAVTGFINTDVSFTGSTAAMGGSTVTVTGSGTTYNVAVSGMGDGNVVASIPAGVATDAAGNGNTASPSTGTDRSVTYDTTAPTVAVSVKSDQENPTDEASVEFTVQFNETVSDFDDTADVTVGGTAGTMSAAITAVDGDTYTVAVTGMDNDGTVTATVGAAKAADTAGNANTAAPTAASVTYDNSDLTFTSIAPVGGTGTVVATFGEPVLCSTVATTDFTATVQTVARVVSAAVCTSTTDQTVELTLAATTLTAADTVSVTVGSGSVSDQAGNPIGATATQANDVPAVSITSGTANNGSVNTTAPAYGGTATDTGGGTVAEVQVSTDGTTFSTTGVTCTNCGTANAVWAFTPPTALSQGTYTFTFRSLDNLGGLSQTAARTVTVDTTAPTVTINKKGGATPQADPTNDSPILFTVTFSEAVTGFVAGYVDLTGSPAGATVSSITGSGPYEVQVSGMTADGNVTAAVTAGAATDAASNPSAASTSTDNVVGYDTTRPTVAVTQKVGQLDPTNASPVEFTATFSEPVTGFTSADVDLDGTAGGKTATVTGGPTIYNIAVTGITSDGTVIVAVPAESGTDDADNENLDSTTTDNTVTYDTTAPTVTVDKKSGQADPTNDSPIEFTVQFSETVTGFTNGDVISSANGSETVTVTAVDSDTYTVAVSNMTDGSVTVTVPAGGANDAAGNGNAASTSTGALDNTVTYDTTAPTVAVSVKSDQENPTDEASVEFTVQFNETVSDFDDTADVTVGGTAGTMSAAITAVDGDTYTVAVTGMDNDGTVTATVGAAKAVDTADNANTAAPTAASATYDNTDPTFTSISPTGGITTPTVVATFSELLACSTVSTGDFTVTVNALPRMVSSVTCTSPSDDTVVLALSGSALAGGDLVSVTLGLDTVEDPAGNDNGNTPTAKTNNVPTVTVSTGPADAASTADSTPTYTGTSSDTGGSVAAFEVSVDGGDFGTSGVAGTTAWSFTPTTALADGLHTIVFRATDNLGGTMSVTRTVTVDTAGPVFQSITATGGSTAVTATFNEPVLCSTVAETDFTATINGNPVTVGTHTCTGTTDSTITVTLASAPSSGQTVAITLAGSGAVTDAVGNASSGTATTRSANAA